MRRGDTPEERARRRYRMLLRLYPPDFRRRYGGEMEEAFLRLRELEVGKGWWARIRLWAGAAWDALFQGALRRLRGGAGRPERPGSPEEIRRRGGDVMGTLLMDVRYALRALVKRPGFAFTAVATLGLGIGANTAIFTLVNALLIRPLPYEAAEELVMLWAANPERGWDEVDINRADAWSFRERTSAFQDLAVMDRVSLTLTGGDRPEQLAGVETTHNLMDVLGVEPARGRDFRAQDNRETAAPVVLLTDGFWQRRFGGDPAVVGTTVILNGTAHTVIGVMPPDFRFLTERPDVFVPMGSDPGLASRNNHSSNSVARLAPGVDLERARQEVAAAAAQLAEEFPETNRGWTAQVMTLRREVLGSVARQASLVLMGAVGFVLLMACVNVANLLLARAGSRRLEMAIRSALGAGRGRVVRQLLTESAVLALLGGVVGIVLAYWGAGSIAARLPDNVPPVFDFSMDGTVLLFAVVVTLGSTLLFGLAPAIRESGSGAQELRDGGRSEGVRAGRFGSTLVVVQTALAVVLLVGGGILMRSMAHLRTQELGFEPENVLVLGVRPAPDRYESAAALNAFYGEVAARVQGLPGVSGVGTISHVPLSGHNDIGTFTLPGEDAGGDDPRTTRFSWVSPGYFEAMELEVVQGRGFTPADREDSPPVVMVNETLARRHFGGDAVGRRLIVTGIEGTLEVVGVVEEHLERGLDKPPEPSIYFSTLQRHVRSRQMVVKTAGPPLALADAVQRALWDVDPNQPVSGVETMDDVVARRVGGYALIAELMGAFALISLVLGAVGIYGVTAYGVGRRTGEIGVRIAMGARRRDVLRLVVGAGMKRALLGLGLGLVAAYALSRVLTSIAVGVSAHDPLTFGSVALVLLVVAFLGCYLPGRRATRIDPVRALAGE